MVALFTSSSPTHKLFKTTPQVTLDLYAPNTSLKTTHSRELSTQHHQSYYFLLQSNQARLPETGLLDNVLPGPIDMDIQGKQFRAILYPCPSSPELLQALGIKRGNVGQQWIGRAVILGSDNPDHATLNALWDGVNTKVQKMQN